MAERKALITGVSAGIGRAAAEAFIAEGWRVYGVDRCEPEEPLERLCFFKCDLADPAALKATANRVASSSGGLDALVNNAAVQVCAPIEKTALEDWDRVMDVNLRPIYLLVKCLRGALNKGGAIVNVSSVHAMATSANIGAYAASKGGVLALTRALALELAGDDIRVNAVLPGAVDTRMLRDGLDRGHLGGSGVEEKLKALGAKTPLGRVGRPEEIAWPIVFLADSRRSSFITGQALVVDGGALARLSTE